MEIVRIILIALVFSIIIIYLKSINKEFALIATIVAGIIILFTVFDLVVEIFSLYNNLASIGGISSSSLKLIIKITLICYFAEFAIGIIEDFGLKSLADKVSIAAKLLIVLLAAPILSSLLNVIKSLIN